MPPSESSAWISIHYLPFCFFEVLCFLIYTLFFELHLSLAIWHCAALGFSDKTIMYERVKATCSTWKGVESDFKKLTLESSRELISPNFLDSQPKVFLLSCLLSRVSMFQRRMAGSTGGLLRVKYHKPIALVSESGSVFLETISFWKSRGKKWSIQFSILALRAEERCHHFPFLPSPFVWQLGPFL